jgi:hypothetical protein
MNINRLFLLIRASDYRIYKNQRVPCLVFNIHKAISIYLTMVLRRENKCTKTPRRPPPTPIGQLCTFCLLQSMDPPPPKKAEIYLDAFRGFMGLFGILTILNLPVFIGYSDRNTSINQQENLYEKKFHHPMKKEGGRERIANGWSCM